MDRTIILATAVAIAVGATTGSLYYASRHRTCAADNQAYHAVVRNWGKTNVTDLSRVLTRMQSDSCKVEGSHE